MVPVQDIIIIGGGISGVSATYEIARAGHRVTLLEKTQLGAMASGWTLGGVRQSGRHPVELPLAQAAVARWQTLDQELGQPTGYRQGGNLRLARSDDEVATIRALVADQRALGLDLEFLPDLQAVRAVAPAVGDAVLAASFCAGDGHADPHASLAAYAAAAVRHGATIREGVAAHALVLDKGRVIGVETSEGALHCDRVVVAAGVHAPELLGPRGISLPIMSKLVCVLQTVPTAPVFSQVFGVANADAAGRQELSGRFRVTNGIDDWSGDPTAWTQDSLQPRARDIAALIGRVAKVLPGFVNLGIARVWGGLIDLTPDALPVIDAHSGIDGLVIATGFSGHGFGIGPVTGEIVAALTLGSETRFDLSGFRCNRFKVGQNVRGRPGQASLTLHG